MRHAKSDWADASLSDHERPLNERGRRDAPLMAQWLLESGYLPDKIIHSTALRCVETVDLMVQAGLAVPAIEPWGDLYLATAESTLGMIDAHPGTTMLVGHNPGFTILATQLAQDSIEMPTASVCVFEFDAEAIEETSASSFLLPPTRLLSFMRPKTVLKERDEGTQDG